MDGCTGRLTSLIWDSTVRSVHSTCSEAISGDAVPPERVGVKVSDGLRWPVDGNASARVSANLRLWEGSLSIPQNHRKTLKSARVRR
jgi:hypothetical protein